MKTKPENLSEDDLDAILSDIAQSSGSAIARIQAIKELRRSRRERENAAPGDDGFAELDDLEPRRRKAA